MRRWYQICVVVSRANWASTQKLRISNPLRWEYECFQSHSLRASWLCIAKSFTACTYHPVFDPEPLEQRKLLATGPVIGPVPLPNPAPPIATAPIAPPPVPTALSGSATTATPPPVNTAAPTPAPGTPAILPTNNSSSSNTPGVSPMVPAPLDVALDGSASVTTSPSSAISALIPGATSSMMPGSTSFVSYTGGLVYIVPMPDSALSELTIATPESQTPNSPMMPQWSSAPVVFHAINAPVSVGTNNPQVNNAGPNNPPVVLQNQPGVFVPMEHVGQSLQTEFTRPIEPKLGPPPDPPPLIDVVHPFQPVAPGEQGKTGKPTADQPNAPRPGTEQPKAEQPKTEQPKAEQPTDAPPAPEHAPPARDAQPTRSLPIPIPIPIPGGAAALDHAVMPEASRAISSRRGDRPSDVHAAVSAAFGVVAGAGSLRLAMGESRRFGMHWLPPRVASSRSARPRVHGR